MAVEFRWPFRITDSKVKQLEAKIAELEKRAVGGVNVPGELFNALYGAETGGKVDEANAFQLAPVYQAINILCDSLNIPLEVYKRTEQGRVPVDRTDRYEHQVRFLLHTSPNLMMTPSQWFQLMETSRLIYGNGYSYIIRDKLKMPTALRWFHPDLVEVKLYNNRELRYWFKDESGSYELKNVSHEDVIHVKNVSQNGVTGVGVIALAAESLYGGLAAQKTSNKFYSEGMTSKVVLSHPQAIGANAKAKLQGAFEDELKKRPSLVVEEGVKVYLLSIPPQQAQFLENRTFSVQDVARWFNLPEFMLNNNQHSTFSNIEHQFLQFQMMNLRPRTRIYEQEFNWKLLGNSPEFYTEFNMNALMRADSIARAQFYMTGIQNGYLLANEVRALENLNNLPGGDKRLTPMNMITDEEREKNLESGDNLNSGAPGSSDNLNDEDEQNGS